MPWQTIYDTLTGGDVAAGGYLSVATVVADPLPPEFASKVIAGLPQREQWNTSTLEWEPKPPPPPDIDRVEEIIVAIEAVQPLNTRVKNAIRPELEVVLGDQRFRDPEEDYVIRREP